MSELSPSAQPEERLRADLLLLLTAVIWGTAFVAQRTAAQSTSVFLFNGMRFLLGALVLLPLAWRNGDITNPVIRQRRSLLGILVAGLLIFTAGTFQQMGLRYTTAGNAGFISGLYVVLIPVILAISGKQRQRPAIWIAVLLATVGLFLLSTGGQLRLKLGDSLELAGALVFAFHVIWIGQQVQRIPVLPLAIGQYLITALFSLAIGIFIEPGAALDISQAWLAIIYTGIFSIGMGYTLQAVGQRVAPPTDAAILLCMEAPFAALSGWLILSEQLSAIQLLGCGLMLAAMLLAQIAILAKNPKKT
jgi:drug/metabolite transporter (DMT)-like permease